MAVANAHYYATRDPFGVEGDFVTAPEISQMFGELIGVWCADLWQRADRPRQVHYVELGPGRGTLAHDALRAMEGAGLIPKIEFVETSPLLRAAQASAADGARWHDTVASLPENGALLIVANEFFDALPVRQFSRVADGWRERALTTAGGGFAPVLAADEAQDFVPVALRDAPAGRLFESSPASTDIVQALGARLARQGGAALIIDYGHVRSALGETLQAVQSHAYADVFAEPGTRDLTAHVDFEALASAAHAQGLKVCGPRVQGEWLTAMGINARAAMLAKADPKRAGDVAAARARMVGASEMGRLFKVMALVAPGWPQPEGF